MAERRGKKRIFEQRDRSEWLAVPVPRIVSDDVWEQAQLQLRRHRAESPRRQRRFYLLRGLVRCGICGYVMVGKPSGKALYYTCYVGPELRKAERRCSWHAVPARSLERVVRDQIVLALSQPDRG